jgi:hypothetical protein
MVLEHLCALAAYRWRIARAHTRRATRPITLYSASMPLLKKNDRFGAKSSIFMPRARKVFDQSEAVG